MFKKREELLQFWLDESETTLVSRPMFTDLFGGTFYQNYRLLHVLLEGFVRFFWIPVVYGVFGIGWVLKDRTNQLAPLVPLIYYISLSIIGNGIQMINLFISLHISPNIFMASGDYYSINTLLALSFNSIPLLIGLYFIRKETRNVNI